MSATGDHSLVEERIPYCQKLVTKGAMHYVRRYLLSQLIDHGDHLLLMTAQVVIDKHNERAGRPLIEHACREVRSDHYWYSGSKLCVMGHRIAPVAIVKVDSVE